MSTNTCDCWSAPIVTKWTGVINRRYKNHGPNDLNCYKFRPQNSCQEANGNRYYYGNIIFGTANARGRCGAKIRQLTEVVAGHGSPKKEFRLNGPLKLQNGQDILKCV